ncbi:MAG: RNA-binding S4 domain-containing protein [Erysipelotrichia bacterium]|nr:RNA-binding S4 domain-containing protein [Erysipelotrichia bacterium]NCC54023.1 RNA-binding S4 domain-containing protein [Erysipelotrichia bacterium]
MRLDKYLKVARILKRRTVAKELADQQRILVNGRKAKPSTEIKLEDIICVQFGNRELTIKVLATPKQVNKNDAALMFEVLDEKRIEKEPLV